MIKRTRMLLSMRKASITDFIGPGALDRLHCSYAFGILGDNVRC